MTLKPGTSQVSLTIGNWIALVSLCCVLMGAIIKQSNDITRLTTLVENQNLTIGRHELDIDRLESRVFGAVP